MKNEMDILHRKLPRSGGCLSGAKMGKGGFPWWDFGKTYKKEDKTVLKKAEKTIDKISVMG